MVTKDLFHLMVNGEIQGCILCDRDWEGFTRVPR